MIDVSIKSHRKELKNLKDETVEKILWQMGAKAEAFAKEGTPVDTGRLRNSITFVVKNEEGKTVAYTDEHGNQYEYTVGEGLENDTVAIGTNVEYAKYVEMGTSKMGGKHMLENAVSQHGDVYEKIIKKELKAVKS